MEVGPRPAVEIALERRFSRKAYDRFKLLETKLLAAGHDEVDILLRLDGITKQAAFPDRSGDAVLARSNHHPEVHSAFNFFGYVLVCTVTRTENGALVRIIGLEEA